MPKPTLPILSLFCGAGGMDLGFEESGFHPVLSIDSDPSAVDSYNVNRKTKSAVVGDLAKLSPSEIATLWDESSDKSPVGIIGGPPCQGFSVGNCAADPADPRNRLPYRYADILSEFFTRHQLDFFVFENVPGLTGRKHASRFSRIKSRFRKAGFKIYEAELDAFRFGVAQHRRRLFVVGIRTSHKAANEFQFPAPACKERTVRDVIEDLPEPSLCRAAEPNKHHPNHWTMQPKSWRFKEKVFNGSRSFRQLDWDAPSWTVAYGNREIHVHPSGERRLSVFEALLLQGFPKSYQLSGTFSAQIDQVSNAVPPPVAVSIAEAIKAHLYRG